MDPGELRIGGFAPGADADSSSSPSDAPESGLARQRVTPFPSYVTVSPVAVMGDLLWIGGLRGGERVHVFGQGARPFSAVGASRHGACDRDAAPGGWRRGRRPGSFPASCTVQVLAPGQPATGSTFVKVLLVDDPAVLAELDALGRGAGALRASLVPAGAPALPAARGFVGPAAFERFLHDLGALLESHWRSLLYTPAGRAATRVITRGLLRRRRGRRVPGAARRAADVVEDVDAQKSSRTTRRATASFPKRRFFGNGFSRRRRLLRAARNTERRRKRNVANRTFFNGRQERKEERESTFDRGLC